MGRVAQRLDSSVFPGLNDFFCLDLLMLQPNLALFQYVEICSLLGANSVAWKLSFPGNSVCLSIISGITLSLTFPKLLSSSHPWLGKVDYLIILCPHHLNHCLAYTATPNPEQKGDRPYSSGEPAFAS